MLKPLPVTTPLPSHVEEAIQAMAAMHAAHRKQASSMERWIDQVIFVIARPIFPVYIVCFMIVWIGAGFLAAHEGLPVLDQAPYPILALSVSCAALFIAVLILASQRRADRLANLREQMTLETVLLTTQKASKLIDLIEELRRDIPGVKKRVDLEAVEMAGMPDHEEVITAIQGINESVPGSLDQKANDRSV